MVFFMVGVGLFMMKCPIAGGVLCFIGAAAELVNNVSKVAQN